MNPSEPNSELANTKDPAPIDKKRIALIRTACGPPDRIVIRGQVVDIAITAAERDEIWDPFLSLPISRRKTIRPIEDLGLIGVRRARLQAEIIAVENAKLSPTEIELREYEAAFVSDEFTADSNSFFSVDLHTKLMPGSYFLRIILRGVDSLRQNLSDLTFIGDADSLAPQRDLAIGFGRLHILREDYDGYVITSDIDQTLLDTRIESNRGRWETLFESPDAKLPLPGMPELFRRIQKSKDGPFPLFFISASPHFFHRTFLSLFDHHEIPLTGLHLKHFLHSLEGSVKRSVWSFLQTGKMTEGGLINIMRRGYKAIASSFDGIFDQVAYKLICLLENRLNQTAQSREILIGDNTESDFFIFTLYQHLISGKLSHLELKNFLFRLSFHNREAISRDAAARIEMLTEKNIAIHGTINSVCMVFINLAKPDPDRNEMMRLALHALPELIQTDHSFAPDICQLQASSGALGIALSLLKHDILQVQDLRQIWLTMEGKELSGMAVDRTYLEHTLSLCLPDGMDCDAIRNIIIDTDSSEQSTNSQDSDPT